MKFSQHARRLALSGLAVFSLALSAQALADPFTVTDMAGRKVHFNDVPDRIALQDGRVGMDLALLKRDNPFEGVVAWNNLIRRQQPGLWASITKQWPATTRIADMHFTDNGEVNVEKLIAEQPQVLIAELRARPVLEQNHAIDQLKAVGIPVVFVDDTQHSVPNAAKSLLVLGKVLGHEKEAQAYYDYYQSHLKALQQTIAKQPKPRPKVFVEALAGQNDADDCCFTHGDFGWGRLVQAVGATNMGSQLLHSPAGQVGLETLLSNQPDVIVMTGRGPSPVMPEFGFDPQQGTIDSRMTALAARNGFAELDAVQQGRLYGIYHPFYSSVLNIVALEELAKMIYPDAFKQLDPQATFNEILSKFTSLSAKNAVLAAQAPKQG